jgi:hypothetical protein
MVKLPAEVRLLVVERVSPVENLAILRLVSKAWRDSVDASFVRTWVQQLPAGEQFAASLNAGLQIICQHANGRGSFAHTLSPLLYLVLSVPLDTS